MRVVLRNPLSLCLSASLPYLDSVILCATSNNQVQHLSLADSREENRGFLPTQITRLRALAGNKPGALKTGSWKCVCVVWAGGGGGGEGGIESVYVLCGRGGGGGN